MNNINFKLSNDTKFSDEFFDNINLEDLELILKLWKKFR